VRIAKTFIVVGLIVGNAYAETVNCKVLPQGDGRIWQTVFNETAPLEWRWRLDAVKADVVVTNLLTREVSTTPVTREVGAVTGSIAMPNPTRSADTGEGLVDISLMQYGETGDVLRTETARLAFLPAVIRVESGKAMFAQNGAPRIASYDPKWTVVPAGEATLAKTVGGETTETALQSSGGYFDLEAMEGTVAVKYDGTVALYANVYEHHGLVLIVR